MARPITNIPHGLGRAEARQRIEDGFATVQQQLQGGLISALTFQNQWDGDQLTFVGDGLGQTVRGKFTVHDETVQIQIELPRILAALADRITGVLKSKTQLLLEKPRHSTR